MDNAAFLEREFEPDGHGLLVRLSTPSKAPGGEFQCRYSIMWPEREVRRYARGPDGIWALMLAMRTVHTELVESDTYMDGRLTWCEQPDFELPLLGVRDRSTTLIPNRKEGADGARHSHPASATGSSGSSRR